MNVLRNNAGPNAPSAKARVVLAWPNENRNIGSVYRAMKTMGIHEPAIAYTRRQGKYRKDAARLPEATATRIAGLDVEQDRSDSFFVGIHGLPPMDCSPSFVRSRTPGKLLDRTQGIRLSEASARKYGLAAGVLTAGSLPNLDSVPNPGGEKQFDAALCAAVLHHIPDHQLFDSISVYSPF